MQSVASCKQKIVGRERSKPHTLDKRACQFPLKWAAVALFNLLEYGVFQSMRFVLGSVERKPDVSELSLTKCSSLFLSFPSPNVWDLESNIIGISAEMGMGQN